MSTKEDLVHVEIIGDLATHLRLTKLRLKSPTVESRLRPPSFLEDLQQTRRTLKHTPIATTSKTYAPRHPVLRELLTVAVTR